MIEAILATLRAAGFDADIDGVENTDTHTGVSVRVVRNGQVATMQIMEPVYENDPME